MLPFHEGVGLHCDVDGDGKSEYLLADKNNLYGIAT
jgi:hypothetical protein